MRSSWLAGREDVLRERDCEELMSYRSTKNKRVFGTLMICSIPWRNNSGSPLSVVVGLFYPTSQKKLGCL